MAKFSRASATAQLNSIRTQLTDREAFGIGAARGNPTTPTRAAIPPFFEERRSLLLSQTGPALRSDIDDVPIFDRLINLSSYSGKRKTEFLKLANSNWLTTSTDAENIAALSQTIDHHTVREVEMHLFNYYANFGRSAEMRVETLGSPMFAKFMRECPEMIGGSSSRSSAGPFVKFEMTKADLCFIRCKPSGERRIGFRAFRKCLRRCAMEKTGNRMDETAAYGLVFARIYSQNPAVLRHNIVDTVALRRGESSEMLTTAWQKKSGLTPAGTPLAGRARETIARVEVASAYADVQDCMLGLLQARKNVIDTMLGEEEGARIFEECVRDCESYADNTTIYAKMIVKAARTYNAAYDLWKTLKRFENMKRVDICRTHIALEAENAALQAETAALRAANEALRSADPYE